ncbi:hypothetical protein GF420_01400 [candidate division GN15 bacterium]|nr:hypothetical protein [candidate division GN15 bacterium]
MKRLLLTTFTLTLFLTGAVLADSNGGAESPFMFGAGARELALGGSGIAVADPAFAPFWNPARLAHTEQYRLGAYHSSLYESDVAYQYVGLALPTLDFGTLGVGVFRLGVSGIERRDAGNVLLGEFDDSRLGFYIGYGRQISGYDVGAALTIEHQSLDSYSSTTSPGLNLSVGRRFDSPLSWLDHVSVVLSGDNLIKPSMTLADDNVSYPFTLDAGAALGMSPGSWDHELTLAASMVKVDQLDALFALGLEYSLADLLHLRGGVRDSKLSFGVGLTYKAFSFDYALVDRDLGELHMFTLTSGFGKTMSQRRDERQQEREAAFNEMMNDRLVSRNRETVFDLVEEGRRSLNTGEFESAVELFDRARFMARTSGVDSTEIVRLGEQAQGRLDEVRRILRYDQFLDSAQVELASRDYLAARYFASRALTEMPQSSDAQSLLNEANRALHQSAEQDEMIQQRLWKVDSLLSYGHVDEANSLIRLLEQYADRYESVQRAIRRVEFEKCRELASAAFARNDLQEAQVALDSATTLFPGHQWCADLKARIEQRLVGRSRPETPTRQTATRPLSPELEKEVRNAYQAARQAFQQGDLETAITRWETVERLAPGYQSVREYLVNAYKFVGVERYGKNELRAAIEIWRKAARLAPDNKEIADYIERTENEIRRLEELSYEQ